MKTSNYTFCTIITPNYLPYAQALFESLKNHSKGEVDLQILISCHRSNYNIDTQIPDEMQLFFIEEVCQSGIGKDIHDKYHSNNMDAFRWSMKPVFINYLLQYKKFVKVIYVDCDIFFFSDFSFLFNELDEYNILLTPHWRPIDPFKDAPNFKYLFNHGLFNAGFIGVNSEATAAMDWWAKACLFSCENGAFEGQLDDQTYLNLLPVYFEKVHIIKHKGCNVAAWNRMECSRVLQSDRSVLIDSKFPIIFVHFASPHKLSDDMLLIRYYNEYLQTLRKYSEEIFQKEAKKRLGGQSEKKFQSTNLSHLLFVNVRMILLKLILVYSNQQKCSNILVFSDVSKGGDLLLHYLRFLSNSASIVEPIKSSKLLNINGLDSLNHRFFGDDTEIENLAKFLNDKILVRKSINYQSSRNTSLKEFLRAKKWIIKNTDHEYLIPYISKERSEKLILYLSHPCTYAHYNLMKNDADIESELNYIFKINKLTNINQLNNYKSLANTAFEKLVLIWCLKYADLLAKNRNISDFIVVYHENLFTNPENELNRIFQKLHLQMPTITNYDLRPAVNKFSDGETYFDSEVSTWDTILTDKDRSNIDAILNHFNIVEYSAHDKLPQPFTH